MRLDPEGEIAQDLRPQAIAQADILESDHPPVSANSIRAAELPSLRCRAPTKPSPASTRARNWAFTRLSRCRQTVQPEAPNLPDGGVCHGFRSINGRLVRSAPKMPDDAMLIVCPNCATSYSIEPASLRRGWPYRPLRPLQNHMVRERPGAGPGMTASAEVRPAEARARRPAGVIRPDDRSPAPHGCDALNSTASALRSRRRQPTFPHTGPVAIADAPSAGPANGRTAIFRAANRNPTKPTTSSRDASDCRRAALRRVDSSHWTALILVLLRL